MCRQKDKNTCSLSTADAQVKTTTSFDTPGLSGNVCWKRCQVVGWNIQLLKLLQTSKCQHVNWW